MPYRPHFKVDDLSDEAQRIIRDGLDRHRRQREILAQVASRGEKLSRISLIRYGQWYNGEKHLQAAICGRAEGAFDLMRRMGKKMTAGAQAELLGVLYEAAHLGELKDIGPDKAGHLALAFAESARKDRQLKLSEKKLALERHQAEPSEKPGRRSKNGREGNQGSPAEAIREIFGISNEK